MCTLNNEILSLTIKYKDSVNLVYFIIDTTRDYENSLNYHIKVNLDENKDFNKEINLTDNQAVIN